MTADEGTPPQSFLKLRFPDGDVEIRWTSKELPVGVLVRSRGTLWRVSQYVGDTVVLLPASPEDEAQHGPVTKPTPLGDDSIILETILEV
jgi:hypothetical protein